MLFLKDNRVMPKIYLGTSGYSYTDWVGPFYTDHLAPKDFLDFYALEFPFVELNFSYYSMPRQQMMQSLVAKTPPNFIFSIKAHQSLTHEHKQEYLGKNVAIFKEGIRPLQENSRLGCVLFQFPYSFHYTRENRLYLNKLFSLFNSIRLAVEFCNSKWLRDSVLEALGERQICFVNVDQPSLPRLLKPSSYVTAEFAYLRFHGRNTDNWWLGDNSSRYDYLYSDSELSDYVTRIKDMLKKARLLFISFNNHARAQAVFNARRLKSLLLEENLDLV